MKNDFLYWLKKNKEQSITKPEKYVNTIVTISNDLSRKSLNVNLYDILDPYEACSLQEKYFSYKEYFEKNKTGNRMYSRALDLYLEFLLSEMDTTINKEIVSTENILTETEKENVILSRIGQGKFRRELMELWRQKCVITGVSQAAFLIASHIKPWKDSNNKERIDKYNGFLLSPTYDKLFDSGYISFQNDGSIIISKSVLEPDKLHVSNSIKIQLFPQNIKYLEFHREYKFIS